jgi:hypothetical protein
MANRKLLADVYSTPPKGIHDSATKKKLAEAIKLEHMRKALVEQRKREPHGK